jgi:hypothetical protein
VSHELTLWNLAGGIVGGGWAGMGSLSITNWFKGEKVFKVPRKYGGYFRNEADHRDYVCIGTAAGSPSIPRNLALLSVRRPLPQQSHTTLAGLFLGLDPFGRPGDKVVRKLVPPPTPTYPTHPLFPLSPLTIACAQRV